jgi:uncharacterized protein with PIN domain
MRVGAESRNHKHPFNHGYAYILLVIGINLQVNLQKMVEKFLLTKEVGRLARWLRILGYDAVYFKEDNTSRALLLALREDRIIITRNKVFFDKVSLKSVYLKEERIQDQLKKVIKELNIEVDEDSMFTRCVVCNRQLSEIEKGRIKDRVPEYVFKTQDEFMECPECRRVYWPGSHWGNIRRYVKELVPKIKN